MDWIRSRAPRGSRTFPASAGGACAALVLAAALTAPSLAPRAFADGDSRPATAEEKKFHALVMGAFGKAVPAGPKGWVQERSESEAPDRVSTGSEKYPTRVDYRVTWTDRQRLDEAEPAKLEAMTKLVSAPDPELQELMRKNEKLAVEFGEAVGKGDQARGARIGKEIDALQQKMETLNATRDQRMSAALERTTPRDTSLTVSLVANEFSVSFYHETAAEAPIAGGLVFRTKEQFDQNNGWREGTTYVFLGKGWKLIKDEGGSRVETRGRPGAPSLAVQAIVVRVDADAARARAFLAKVDWDALKKLLAN